MTDLYKVSVVITTYNHSQFLPEAIQSVILQNYPAYEIIVVDDGSTDDTNKIVSSFHNVKYIYQINKGLSSARNTGWKFCSGEYVIFLDADDRLLPQALESGLNSFNENPEAVFTAGHFRFINAGGIYRNEYNQIFVETDKYAAFLNGNFIGMHAAVMYRRSILQTFNGFDENLRACEDYDLYLRITAKYKMISHRQIVAEYRIHSNNMSGNYKLMLVTILNVLNSHSEFVKSNNFLRKQMRLGKINWINHYGFLLFKQIQHNIRDRDFSLALSNVSYLAKYSPVLLLGIARTLSRLSFRRMLRSTNTGSNKVDLGDFAIQNDFYSSGSIEKYYINKSFSYQDQKYTKVGIADPFNLLEDSKNKLSYERLCFDDEQRFLEILHTLPDHYFDKIYLIQVLSLCYYPQLILDTILNKLKKGGFLFLTVPGTANCAPDQNDYYYRFTPLSVRELLNGLLLSRIVISTFGNVLTATLSLKNVSSSTISQVELDHIDEKYPLLISLSAFKEMDTI